MPLTPPKSQSNRVLAPEGTHIARVTKLIELGTQESEWMGEKKRLYKIWLDFELLEETHSFKEGEEAKPFVVGSKYTFSMGSKANLRKIVEGIIGKTLLDHEAEGFDIEQILNEPCLINVKRTVKGDKTYTNIETTAPLMKGMVAKEAYNPIQKLTFEQWSKDLFESLPNFLKEQITTSPEYDTYVLNKMSDEDKDYIQKVRGAFNSKVDESSIDVSEIPF